METRVNPLLGHVAERHNLIFLSISCSYCKQMCTWLLGRPRAYVLPVMYLFLFRHSFSELPWPIALKHKIQRMSLNNFRASGNILKKLLQTTWPEVGVITRVQLLEGPPPKKKNWEGQKTSKFRRDFWQLSTLIANISGIDRHIEHLKKTSSTTTTSTLGEKMVNFGPQTKKF